MAAEKLSPHYPTAAAKRADLAIHIVGLVFAVWGGAYLLTLTAENAPHRIAAISIYAIGMVLMLAFSLAYNFSMERYRAFFRRLDHAGIFIMIAGSYTPFTAHVLTGAMAWVMTTTVWAIAAIGILGKLFLPQLREGIWIAVYLTMGWIVLFAIGPIINGLPVSALTLLVIGGLVYTAGVIFHMNDRLQFSRSIWHGACRRRRRPAMGRDPDRRRDADDALIPAGRRMGPVAQITDNSIGDPTLAVKPHSIDIVVADMGKALAFYRTLGLDAPESAAGEQQVQIETPGGTSIGLLTEFVTRKAIPDWVTPVGQRVTFACLCDSADEVDGTYKKVTEAGYKGLRAPWDSPWGQRYAFVQDPDGNRVDLFAESA